MHLREIARLSGMNESTASVHLKNLVKDGILKGEFDKYHWAMACLNNDDSNELWKFEGLVTVTGKWIGIDCAYENTIFGECVPDVVIESIK